MNSILYQVPLQLFAFILFICILIVHLLGVKTGTYRRQKSPHAVAEGIGPLEITLLGLLQLLMSFTFSMSAFRYDSRRSAIVTEADNIGTAVMNADLYPDSIRTALRTYFQQYLDERIQNYQADDEKEIAASLVKAQAVQSILWKQISALPNDAANIGRAYHMIPALHSMDAAATSRDALRNARAPYSIIWLLIILALLGSFIIGYGKKQRKNDWVILFIYALMTVITLYTILDLDSSRKGLIKTDKMHLKIDELRDLFKQ